MTKIHKVEDGEHISAIAFRHEFTDSATVWNASANGQLRELREDPHQLVPGDEVSIPDPQERAVQCASGTGHRFRVRIEQLKLRLRMLDMRNQPVAGAGGELAINGRSQSVTTGGDGTLTADAQPDCSDGALELREHEYLLVIGGLPPVSEALGQAARLVNLGYWFGFGGALDDPDAFALGVELFQNENGLRPTAKVDDEFIAKLAAVHDGKSGE